MEPIKMRPLSVQRAVMSPMVRNYWAELDRAHDEGKKVIYCLGMVPQEIFRTVDGVIFFGENFSASCAVARASQELCEAAEAQGFPMELCSYARTSIGAMITGRNPMGKSLPKPDAVAYLNSRCSAYAGWGKVIKEMNPDIPVLAIDLPPMRDGMGVDEYNRAHAHVVRQLHEVIEFVTDWSGKRFDHDLFAELVDNAGRGARAFLSLLNTLRTKPAPISLIDIFFQFFPLVSLKGRPEVAEYYTAAKAEVDQRIAEGFSPVPEEKFRIYWDGIAIWTRLTNQFQQLARHGAALVAAAYTSGMGEWCASYDSSRPVETIADSMLRFPNHLGLQAKVDNVSRWVSEFQCDAIVMQVSRSCKPVFLDEYELIRRVAGRTGIPYCEVNGDMADPRLYSEQEIEDRIDSFLTGLGQR